MQNSNKLSAAQYKYLELLAETYPTKQEVYTEIINLQAILNLPKGTEHFMSDLHGEYEAFAHILNNCSGVIREKVEAVFKHSLTEEEIAELCTLIYYPKQKLEHLAKTGRNTHHWYHQTLTRLVAVTKLLSSKYTRSKVRKAMPKAYNYILDELLHARQGGSQEQYFYYQSILHTLIDLGGANEFVTAFTALIKSLAVDRLHIVGDIFDRGARPDAIVDMLMECPSLDIEWGNHDILWMGAAAGSEICIAGVVRNSLSHQNMDVLEKGYAISLRPLLMFAMKTYPNKNPAAAALQVISIILFKLEGQWIRRNPDFHMEERRLLDKINRVSCSVHIGGKDYALKSAYFPTLEEKTPYELTDEEAQIVAELKTAFLESERLRRHVRFLYKKGSMYLCFNENLLFHGCVPLRADGSFKEIIFDGVGYKGKAYFDYTDRMARQAYFGARSQKNLDFMWYLWCGSDSPLSGRIMKTFERALVEDKEAWKEPTNPYFDYCDKEETCRMILAEFNLSSGNSHIINGHVPVKVVKGESPVKADGKRFVIDGGFCRAYQKTTGIAGYTLIYSSQVLRLMSHQPFSNVKKSLEENEDIESTSNTVELKRSRAKIADTDTGNEIKEKISDLRNLLAAYQDGTLTPQS